MATTTYFEQELSAVDSHANADPTKRGCVLEVQISSFSGTHQLYLKHTDGEGNESYSLLSKEHARELLDSLDRAMFYLGYTEEQAKP